mmetsp:Transcript_8201/g.20164  ORF Transcript_8201/g.20164 Transcript_8201/m.20164 type:complete len:336 (-) Transcript_8201:892-1899(-)
MYHVALGQHHPASVPPDHAAAAAVTAAASAPAGLLGNDNPARNALVDNLLGVLLNLLRVLLLGVLLLGILLLHNLIGIQGNVINVILIPPSLERVSVWSIVEGIVPIRISPLVGSIPLHYFVPARAVVGLGVYLGFWRPGGPGGSRRPGHWIPWSDLDDVPIPVQGRGRYDRREGGSWGLWLLRFRGGDGWRLLRGRRRRFPRCVRGEVNHLERDNGRVSDRILRGSSSGSLRRSTRRQDEACLNVALGGNLGPGRDAVEVDWIRSRFTFGVVPSNRILNRRTSCQEDRVRSGNAWWISPFHLGGVDATFEQGGIWSGHAGGIAPDQLLALIALQ